MSQDQHDDGADGSADSGGDPPDAAGLGGRRELRDSVEVGWLRPHQGAGARRLGRPRLSTLAWSAAWIGLFVLYLNVRPGG
ncbi:hypothetical protein [Nocardia vermiculata]|uniref:Uncharacterized protein n=1 Tax=Nocardia vermiculata TaxID=257274 RepID=A0A846Y1H0_9NOCA|nr:hypothetical protein [Nocardia vermiculata]NKY51882.1 hypothetical protein [Nocardia vermiculata]